MKIEYDPDADAMYITLLDKEFHHNKKLDKYIIADYDKENNLLGIEILFVKETNPDLLKNVQLNFLSA